MRIALTVWEDRISPVFDAATTILLAEIQNGSVLNRRFVPFNPGVSWRMAEMLKEMGISVMICGAISKAPADVLSVSGIEVIPFIAGETERILDSYAKGNPIIPAFSMPGIRKQCRQQIRCILQKEIPGMSRKRGTGSCGHGTGTGKGKCKTASNGGTGPYKRAKSGQGRNQRQGQGQTQQERE